MRDALLGRDPRDLDLVVEGDAAEVARRLGEEPLRARALRHRDRATASSTSPPRGASATSAGCAAGGRARRADRRGPRAPRLHRQRDRRAARGRGAARRSRARSRTSRRGGCACCTTRSFLDDPTRLLRLVRYAARLRFQIEQATRELAFAAVEGGALATVTPSRLGAELRLLLASRSPAAMCGLEAFGIGPRLLPGFDVDPDLVERAQRLTPPDAPRRTSWRWPRPASTPPRRTSPGASTRCEFPARERDTVAAAATRARGARAGAGRAWRARRRSGRCCGARRPRRSRWPARWARPSRPGAGSTTSATRQLAITGDDLLAAGLEGPAVGRALDAATAAMLDGEADRPRGAAGGGAGGRRHNDARWTCPSPSPGATSTSAPPCPAARCCSPPAAAASPRARSPRSTSAG